MAGFSISRLLPLFSSFALGLPAFCDIVEPLSNITTFQVPEADTQILTIYNSSLFQGMGAIDIQDISFYSQGGISGITGESPIQIYLGTTLIPSTSLNPTYSDNVMDGETLVYAGTLVPAAGEATEGFTITLSLLAPFLYQPSDGNLVLDIQNTGGAAMFPYPVAFSDGSYAVEGTNSTGTIVQLAPVVEFTGTPEPKPSVLLLTVLVPVLVSMRRVKKRSQEAPTSTNAPSGTWRGGFSPREALASRLEFLPFRTVGLGKTVTQALPCDARGFSLPSTIPTISYSRVGQMVAQASACEPRRFHRIKNLARGSLQSL